ncbi:MAG: MaoC family dehydratase [SAR86 cluster bacterium]|jgi:acyl dehydratase|uniref:MaoC family dehydratase n=1 Tax=SAR86 cluster bacterium TaxID=2030880 RepID=A0A520N1U3_9GAMM|nr:MAG: MaoC family dehydratase [Gammaproteobacteria bacterium TMED225]RZO27448.1 MAG: MaoC family dehydratase [SAR86 cluster bacterium]|tara:strand:+ start:878 stop:1339 length:462 start_codon:yes stop_codon:yes gene_type:complete
MFTIVKPSEIDTVLGTEVGVSDWVTIDQDRINKFADATMDHQFIHVDPEQATPVFGSTIAHGFLSLSMVAGIPFEQEIGMVLDGTKMGLNYGLDKVRFLSPVPVNSEVRIRMKCIDVTEKNPGQYLAKTEVTMEIKGVDKPAFVAETLSMFIV